MNRRAYVIAKCDMHSVREFAEVAFAHVGQNREDYVKTDTPHSRSVEVDILLGNPARAKGELGWSARILLLGLIFVALYPCSPLQAQDFWKVMPLPFDRTVMAMASNPEGDIFISIWQDGLYRTTNRGLTWTKTSLPDAYTLAITTDNNGNLIAGVLQGVYRSTDRGDTWVQIGDSKWETNSVAVDSRGYIYAGVKAVGLMRTKDNGVTWEKILSDSGDARAVLIDLSETVYFTPGRILYRTTDDGMSWTVFNEPFETRGIRSNGMVVSSNNVVYALATSLQGTIVAWTTNKGVTWRDTTLASGDLGTGLINTSANQLFLTTFGAGVYRSRDYGTTWEELRGGMRNVYSGPLTELPDGHVVYGSRGEIGISISPTKTTEVFDTYRFSLNQNVPNPAVGSVTITFSLPTTGFASLTIHDLLGRTVATLLESTRLQGPNEVTFDTRDLRTGTYLYRLQSGTQVQSRPMVVIK